MLQTQNKPYSMVGTGFFCVYGDWVYEVVIAKKGNEENGIKPIYNLIRVSLHDDKSETLFRGSEEYRLVTWVYVKNDWIYYGVYSENTNETHVYRAHSDVLKTELLCAVKTSNDFFLADAADDRWLYLDTYYYKCRMSWQGAVEIGTEDSRWKLFDCGNVSVYCDASFGVYYSLFSAERGIEPSEAKLLVEDVLFPVLSDGNYLYYSGFFNIFKVKADGTEDRKELTTKDYGFDTLCKLIGDRLIYTNYGQVCEIRTDGTNGRLLLDEDNEGIKILSFTDEAFYYLSNSEMKKIVF